MLASQIDEALRTVERVERELDDVPTAVAKPLRAATQLLRAAGLAFQDDSLAAFAIAASHLNERGTNQDCHAASTLCRLGFWRLGKYDSFYSLPRHKPHERSSKSLAVSAMLDLSIEAAVALDHLRLSTAKRVASEAMNIAECVLKEAGGLATFPACLTAQVLYEEGCLDQAELILRDRLPMINAEGPIECALRAYLVLTRIARQRMQYDFAALLLREAEALGERRGWPRLVAACLAERASLLIQTGRITEARRSFEYLDRCAEKLRAGAGHSGAEVQRYRALTRWRVSWAEAPSTEAVVAVRQLYHHALESQNSYLGCGLAVELVEMLAGHGETEEADALFFHTIKVGAAAGLYQIFLDGGAGLGAILSRAYGRTEASGSTDRDVLPYLGTLLSRWNARGEGSRSAQASSRLTDTLSARECDILAMISQGMSNKRVAQSLKISPETVKSHVKNIFGKLAVNTRTEAVSRAGSLGLL
jgi:ATP/maltotriose-dependent transcriptional regulator MalT